MTNIRPQSLLFSLTQRITNTVSTTLTNPSSSVTNSADAWFRSIGDKILSNATLKNFLLSLGVILLLVLIRLVILRIAFRSVENASSRYKWRKSTSYVLLGVGIIVISQVWIREFNSILTYLGLVSAGIAIALKDFVVNFLGWLFIISSKPFEVGDRIQMKEFAGDVIDIRTFNFTLLEIGNWVDADQSTGRILHVPNGKIFTETIANYNRAFHYIWNEIPVLITFESDWRKAKEILQSIIEKECQHLLSSAEKRIKEASKIFMIYYTSLTPTVYTSVRESGILLTIRYLCDPKNRRATQHEIWEKILSHFDKEPSIHFAYRTVTVDKLGEDQPPSSPRS